MSTTYLGETPVVLNQTPFATYNATDWSLYFMFRYGQIDGAHHKSWVLDQVARILHGTPVKVVEASWSNGEREYRVSLGEPSQAYLAWVEQYKRDEESGEEYNYDEGIAP